MSEQKSNQITTQVSERASAGWPFWTLPPIVGAILSVPAGFLEGYHRALQSVPGLSPSEYFLSLARCDFRNLFGTAITPVTQLVCDSGSVDGIRNAGIGMAAGFVGSLLLSCVAGRNTDEQPD